MKLLNVAPIILALAAIAALCTPGNIRAQAAQQQGASAQQIMAQQAARR